MIIELAGHSGVGKLTVARMLAGLIGARLLDNHTIYNPAFAVTEFRSPAFYETVQAVRAIAFERAAALAPDVPLVLTMATGTQLWWGQDWQAANRALADRRAGPLLGVHLHCAHDEHARRITDPSRAALRKLMDPDHLTDGHVRPVLLDHCDRLLDLDTTSLAPEQAAERIRDWALRSE